jgi:hypothetical protein
MTSRSIELRQPVNAEAVMAAARSVAEGRKYLWEQAGPASATAYQGGKRIEKKSSTKLALGVELRDGQLVLSQQTNGTAGFRYNLGAVRMIQVGGEFRKMYRAISAALEQERAA